MKTERRRILFIAEAVTLAHIARPYALAQALNISRYDICFACDPRFKVLLGTIPFSWRDISSISSETFLAALASGGQLYKSDTLRKYIQEDIDAINEYGPDVVVGDFRLSLSISTRVTNRPYVALTNAYWSPYASHRFPVPELTLTKLLGVKVGQAIFNLVRPLAFAYHSLPLNTVRKEFGLPSVGFDLRCVYTDADYTAYADIPEIVSTYELPSHHSYLGPVIWSPAIEMPIWWSTFPRHKPIIYVTLGSSGQSDLLKLVLDSLVKLPVTVIAATAGRVVLRKVPDNAFVTKHLPGKEAAALASLVICNGGSPTSYQALSAGKPVIGIAQNLDQYLNMSYLQAAGVGTLIRAGEVTTSLVRKEVRKMLSDTQMKEKAQRLKKIIAQYDASERFEKLLGQASGRANGRTISNV